MYIDCTANIHDAYTLKLDLLKGGLLLLQGTQTSEFESWTAVLPEQ